MLRKSAVNMLCPLAIAAICALALPTFAAAQEHRDQHHPPGRPAPVRPGVGRPVVVPHGGPVVHGGPIRPGVHADFVFRGHPFHPIPFAHPYVYPTGWGYRRWAVGASLPPLFLVPAYYYTGYAALGLPPPEPGFQWVQYGPDLLLVNVATGQVVDVAYGVFY